MLLGVSPSALQARGHSGLPRWKLLEKPLSTRCSYHKNAPPSYFFPLKRIAIKLHDTQDVSGTLYHQVSWKDSSTEIPLWPHAAGCLGLASINAEWWVLFFFPLPLLHLAWLEFVGAGMVPQAFPRKASVGISRAW